MAQLPHELSGGGNENDNKRTAAGNAAGLQRMSVELALVLAFLATFTGYKLDRPGPAP